MACSAASGSSAPAWRSSSGSASSATSASRRSRAPCNGAISGGIPGIVEQGQGHRRAPGAGDRAPGLLLTASSQAAKHPVSKLFDTFVNTDWQGTDTVPTITVNFKEPVDLRAVILHLGSQDAFVATRRPAELDLTFSGRDDHDDHAQGRARPADVRPVGVERHVGDDHDPEDERPRRRADLDLGDRVLQEALSGRVRTAVSRRPNERVADRSGTGGRVVAQMGTPRDGAGTRAGTSRAATGGARRTEGADECRGQPAVRPS